MKFPVIKSLSFIFLYGINLNASETHHVENIPYIVILLLIIAIAFYLRERLKSIRNKNELQKNLDLFKTTINSTLSAVIIVKNSEIEYLNDESKKLFLINDEKKFLGNGFIRFIQEDYRDLVINNIDQKNQNPYNVVLLKTNKDEFPALIKNVAIEIASEEFYILSIMDTTLIKEQEHERFLFHESKLSSMGKLVGNIAHQWRQPLIRLGNIVLKLEAAKMFDKKIGNQDLTSYTNDIKSTVRFMSNTISIFQDFYQLENRNIVLFSVHEPITDIMNMIKGRLDNLFIEVDMTNVKKINIRGIPSELAQTILIIIENIIEIVENRKINNAKIIVTTKTENENMIMLIEDNVEGIDTTVIDKIFNPYITTKNSTGMGLYIAKKIIENKMKGTIVANNTDDGAVFKITIPRINN